jgi:hypothetical protein
MERKARFTSLITQLKRPSFQSDGLIFYGIGGMGETTMIAVMASLMRRDRPGIRRIMIHIAIMKRLAIKNFFIIA